MTRRYSIAEARSKLPSIIDEAESGAEVELTRHGKPVAVVISRQRFDRLAGATQPFGDAYRAFLAKHRPEDIRADDVFNRRMRPRTRGRRVSL